MDREKYMKNFKNTRKKTKKKIKGSYGFYEL